MKLIAGFLAAALAQETDRWGYYDYYGNGHAHDAKHQSSQTGTEGQLAGNFAGDATGNTEHGILGNGRICWSCSERSYGTCLSVFDTATDSKNIGDQARHGAMYCTGEDYFCFISERRVIRHDQNDYNFEQGQPWSSGTQTVYQEESISFSTSNQLKATNLRVQMGCQQPMACLRQMHQNYKIDMGLPFHTKETIPIATSAAAKFAGLAREGLCRLGADWVDYASGQHSGSNWRDGHWIGGSVRGTDRRYGAVEHHYNYGKGTESVCHYCCDPLLEFSDSSGLYDYKGCNFNAVLPNDLLVSDSTISIDGATTNVAESADLEDNIFIERQQNWESPVWNNNGQYHGMFRNPHTHYPRKTVTTNTGGAPDHPNAATGR